MKRLTAWSFIALPIVMAVSALAQQPQRPQFRLPEVGSILPDVQLFDADGRDYSTRAMRGDYTVLVFGCLT